MKIKFFGIIYFPFLATILTFKQDVHTACRIYSQPGSQEKEDQENHTCMKFCLIEVTNLHRY